MKKIISLITLIMAFASVFVLPAQASGPYIVAAAAIGGVDIGVGFLVGAVLAIIICLVVRAGMKSVRAKGEARDYIVGPLQLTNQTDHYSHTTTTRTKINNSSKR